MTTASDLITRALYPLRDSAQDMFVDAEFVDYLNEAIVDLSARLRLFHEQDASCTITGSVIPLSAVGAGSDVLQVRWVTSPDGYQAIPVDPTTFKAYQIEDPTRPETDPLYSIWDDTIYLHPLPVNGEVWGVGYYAIPAALTTGADTFPLARTWEAKVVRYLRAQGYYRLGEVSLGDREMSSYEQGLPLTPLYDRNAPGSLTLTFEMGAFDIDPGAAHQG